MESTLWYPYTQMKLLGELPKMKGGEGVYMHLEDGRTLIDGISSWWSVIHGYNHPELNGALSRQLSQFAHVMLGGITHDPALKLADKLKEVTPEGLNHVFFSDSGSIGVEVALKIAIQYWKNKGVHGKTRLVSLKNGYHGDTFKAMEVSDDSDFSQAFSEVLHRGYLLDTPSGGFGATLTEIQPAVAALEALLGEKQHELAAFILEPIVQCAGGFHIYSPLYLKAARQLCDKYGVLLIFDEVATGFGRTGKLFAAEHAGVTPDIMVVGKALTAGYMGHAATLATSEVYNRFLGEDRSTALMHGPTFMANALACAVALKGIEIQQSGHYLEKVARMESIIRREFDKIQSSAVVDKRIIGAIGALELKDAALLDGFKAFALDAGAWLRPIGHVVYVMPAYIIEEAALVKLIDVIRTWVERI
jgi:adenosylmethionine-8-amino-7-oxononanoate aminotransferase